MPRHDQIERRLWRALYRHYRDAFQRYGNHPAFRLRVLPARRRRTRAAHGGVRRLAGERNRCGFGDSLPR
ncbi:MAG: hypothetical protein M5R42_01580 [Rhodocyclaceae bacterium]|nr:hypothetical protein [Rhodocyclaceae bacterium]